MHIHAAEALGYMERRVERAVRIVENGHIHRVEDYAYLVDSQTEEYRQYEVHDYGAGWICHCCKVSVRCGTNRYTSKAWEAAT